MLQKIVFWIDKLNGFFLKASAFITLVLVFLTAEQVIARYIFNASSVAMQELQWHLFGSIFLLGGAYTLKMNEHVRVDIFYTKATKNWQRIINTLGILFFLIPSMLVLLWVGIEFVVAALDYQNTRPMDFYSKRWFTANTFLYTFSAYIESILRTYILVGEVSADPGGLEARWLVKALIPFSGFLMLLQAISELIKLWIAAPSHN